MDTTNMYGKISKSAAVFSNDPLNPSLNLYLTAEVKQYIVITPQDTVSLDGFEGERIAREVTITSFLPQPLRIAQITSDIDDKIKYRLKTRRKGHEYLLRIERRSGADPFFQGRITITTDSMKKPKLWLTVLSRLQKEVSVKPEALVFGTIDTQAEFFPRIQLKRTVIVQDLRGEGLILDNVVTSRDWIAASPIQNKQGYTIEISLDKDRLPKGSFEERIEVRMNGKKKSITIPVSGTVL